MITDTEHAHYVDLKRRRDAEKARAWRRRQRQGRVAVVVELDDVNAAERLNLGGDPDKRALQSALQAFVDREINDCVTE